MKSKKKLFIHMMKVTNKERKLMDDRNKEAVLKIQTEHSEYNTSMQVFCGWKIEIPTESRKSNKKQS